MKEYELTVLVHPDLEIDLDKPLKKIEHIITENGGKITKQDNWGKRKLAYPIKKQEFAIYVYYDLEVPAAGVKKINDTLNITDEVLRFLIANVDPREAKAAAAAAERAAHAAENAEGAEGSTTAEEKE
ncbi:MAG TPA: 30S ribosomal protein S6 [Candidatus Saccharimonadales bacterium]|nr:30S ribosomal protein S6 [Candidatus Saccharimonadales bacterium]